MNFSRHGNQQDDMLDDASDELCISGMRREPVNPNDLGASLDMDRHISTQRPARESILRAVRGEEDDDDCLGESFAVADEGHSAYNGHSLHNNDTRRSSNLRPVLDVEGDEEENDDEAEEAAAANKKSNTQTQPALIGEAQKAS